MLKKSIPHPFTTEQNIIEEINKKVNKNSKREMLIHKEKISLNDIYDIEINQLKKLSNNDIESLLNKLPSEIPLFDLSSKASYFLRIIIRKGYNTNLFSKLPEKIDINNLNIEALSFLKEFINTSNYQELLEKLPEKINLNDMSTNFANFLKYFIRANKESDLLQRFSLNINLLDLSDGAGVFLKFLFEKGFKNDKNIIKNILTNLPIMDLDKISYNTSLPLKWLINDEYGLILFNKLPDKIDLNKLSDGGGNLLSKFVSIGCGENLYNKLPDKINLNTLTLGFLRLLTALVLSPYRDNLFNKLPKNINFNNLTKEGTQLLSSFILFDKKYAKKILKRINQFEISNISKDKDFFIRIIIEAGLSIELRNKLLLDKSSLRIPINHKDLKSIDLPINFNLKNFIKNFPIEKGSIRKMNGGWLYAKLMTGNKANIYINLNKNPPKIIFKSKNVSLEQLSVYKKAIKHLPGYVSSPYYPELDEREVSLIPKFYNKGFREAFMGISLEDIDLHKLPRNIQRSINKQKYYILTMLKINNIDHDDTHDGNFNVRFLLIDKNGQKSIEFDPNKAIKLAKENKMTLTPIVILRDWT